MNVNNNTSKQKNTAIDVNGNFSSAGGDLRSPPIFLENGDDVTSPQTFSNSGCGDKPPYLEPPAQEILPGLWIGNQIASQNLKFLKSKKITCIINCTETLPFLEDKIITIKLRVPVQDNLQKDQIKKLYSILNSTINKIYANLPNHNILVHCHAGRQRSATVLAAYLMKFGNLTKKEAIEILRSKRPTVGTPKINFEPVLDQFEVDLLEKF